MKKATIDDVKRINELYYEDFPDDRGKKFAGCNYFVNTGNHEMEPLGTAQSMHDCNGCRYFDVCKMKQDDPVWLFSEEKAKELERLYYKMVSN